LRVWCFLSSKDFVFVYALFCSAKLQFREQIKVDEQIHQNHIQPAEDDTTQRVVSSGSTAAASSGDPQVVDHSFIDDQATYLS